MTVSNELIETKTVNTIAKMATRNVSRFVGLSLATIVKSNVSFKTGYAYKIIRPVKICNAKLKLIKTYQCKIKN